MEENRTKRIYTAEDMILKASGLSEEANVHGSTGQRRPAPPVMEVATTALMSPWQAIVRI
jgi:hypothetical protein